MHHNMGQDRKVSLDDINPSRHKCYMHIVLRATLIPAYLLITCERLKGNVCLPDSDNLLFPTCILLLSHLSIYDSEKIQCTFGYGMFFSVYRLAQFYSLEKMLQTTMVSYKLMKLMYCC